jgi:hypothetical protein
MGRDDRRVVRGRTRRRGSLLLGLALCGVQVLAAGEDNWWPLAVTRPADAAGRPAQTELAGPLFSHTLAAEMATISLRPLYTRFEPATGGPPHWHILYPIFNYYERPDGASWHLLNLVSGGREREPGRLRFEVFPLLFIDRHAAAPERDSLALWPLGGTLQGRLWRDRIDFVGWPLFVRTQRGDERRTHTPWPFIQRLDGPHSRGFGLWPLYGAFERDGVYRRKWALWPLFYHYETGLDQAVPYVRSGFWPLHHSESAAGLRSDTWLWPFFGHTREWAPRPEYRETRYLWPFIVQGRGGERHVNRLLPLYAHETRPGWEKNWYLWPLLKVERFTGEPVRREQRSLLFFVFRDELQSAPAMADMPAFAARRGHLWPLAGWWNDGAERRQFQALDPLGVFFPGNAVVRENWSPLFALYRYDQRGGSVRHSLLWNLVVVRHEAATGGGAFHLGPLFEVVGDGESGSWQVLKGLFGASRGPDGRRLRLLWNDF